MVVTQTTPPSSDLGAIREHLQSLSKKGGIEAALKLLDQARTAADTLVVEKQELVAENTKLTRKAQKLEHQLRQLLKAQTGRRSEKVSEEQLRLMLEQANDDLLADDADVGAELVITEPDDDAANAGDAPQPQARRGRKPLPAHLPREVIHHELEPSAVLCSDCGESMPKLGYDDSEVLEFVPGRYVVRKHRRAKHACRCCIDATVVTAPGPNKPIDKGMASSSLLAHVLVSKFEDHIPLARQSTRFAREGAPIADSTLGGWVKACAEMLSPLYDAMWARVHSAYLTQVDASGINVLDRDVPTNMVRGTMWCYVANEANRKTVLFDYAKRGDGASGPWQRLAGRTGYIQADAASVFDRLYNGQVAHAVEVGCWAHARRKFHALADADPRAAQALKLIGKLFRVERDADAKKLSPDKRRQLRLQRSKPTLDRLVIFLAKLAAREPPDMAIVKAANYTLRHKDALSRFLEDGRLTLTNNFNELQIRTLAIGRKNYLFAGSHHGAKRTAIIYSLLRTCAVNRVDPFAYLVDVFDKLAGGWPNRRLDELLPDHYAEQSR